MKISQRQAGLGILSCALLLVLAPAVLTAQPAKLNLPAGAEQAAAKAITRDALEGPIRFLSDDLLEGRGPGSRGDELTQVPVPRVSLTAAGESNLGLMVSAQMSGRRSDDLTIEGKLSFASYDRTEPCAQDNRPYSLTFVGPKGDQ